MEKAKRYSETDLFDFHSVSPVFKKYSQFNLWSENFSEYNNIKYCEIYFSKYFFGLTQKYLLENFSESFLLTLHNSPKFLKFIKSGFFKYINFHFLVLFQSNRFFFGGDYFQEVEIFVEEYFQRYIQIFFEQDLLICLIACVNEIVPKSFRECLNNRLKLVYNDLLIVDLNTKPLSNSVVILNLTKSNKNTCYYLGFIDSNNIIRKFYFERSKANIPIKKKSFYFFFNGFSYKIYKSLSVLKEIPGVRNPTFFLEDTIYNWGYCITSAYKIGRPQIFNYDLFKSLTGYKYFILNQEVESSLKSTPFIKSRGKCCFYTFSKCAYKLFNTFPSYKKKKDSNNCNYDLLLLLESSQALISFDKKRNDIGIYRDNVDVFIKNIKSTYPKLVDTTVIRFPKPFECTFNKFFNNIYLGRGLENRTEYEKVFSIACKKAFKKLEYSFETTYKVKSLPHFFDENGYEFWLNIEDIFNIKFNNSYTNFKVANKDPRYTSKVVLLNTSNIFKSFYKRFGEEFTTISVTNSVNYKKKKVQNIILGRSFIQSRQRINKIIFLVFLLVNFSNKWGLYSCRNFSNINKFLFLFHLNSLGYKYLFKCNCAFSFSDKFYIIKMNLLFNFCFLSYSLFNDNFYGVQSNFLINKKKSAGSTLEEKANVTYVNTKSICSKKASLEVSDYEDDEDILEEFVVDLFSK
uniref:hypothetical protein n=1 Tax=Alaria marginata TaxID=98221 RepID=UPI001D0F9E08|nr:hypothetical protein LK120_mgp17 [Alaria marginata]UAX19713.1 hypothetical protein [Alaria marginata]WKY96733.1 hypothetical protein [Alaria marginata]WKY96771.1 hypothetical protein [Alaria marginata]WKY96809.1 hypothetical protein [Alaria marginata]WKY96847.1 hypothetical protein [Alaria marginata]